MFGRFQRDGWRSCLVILLLLWALGDLTVPDWCVTDVGSMLATSPTAAPVVAGPQASATVARVAQSDSFAPSAALRLQNTGEDDCWCCCSHIAPPPQFALAHVDIQTQAVDVLALHATPGVTAFLYHPPRA